MILCDYSIDRYVRDEYFERLNSLSPVRRTVEMFDAEIELLTLEMRGTTKSSAGSVSTAKIGNSKALTIAAPTTKHVPLLSVRKSSEAS